MNEFMSGALCMGYFVAAVFFLKFWKRSRDLLFFFFAVAFAMLGLQRLSLSLTAERLEDDTVFYLLRLAAFVLIIGAIWHKNISSRR